ncbi:bifunctional riboflavin kinase/FAD synthetase [Alkalicoccus urumqiensis]|uniref:Riboflavin biosynthesis protein n=1 Tax=Alkalicoccus urumqiensis TaxID=1548213 RepID=A0A2P6MFW9_ALKUR|nr:bifunctional riboflavin kinase/FAD synthetase [Alkalicoccus urumqiensis]PRO65186.1 bifunctional riboflavin kinase/FAD synthetase [Alkalicoccus urumqiensis]
MRIIKITHPDLPSETQASVCALGFFDGVHRGHKKVLQEAVREAEKRSISAAAMTFTPHPKEVLRGETAPLLTPDDEKASLIEAEGIDILYMVTFDERFADLSPQEFVDDYIIGLQIEHVAAGFDYTYGSKGKGTMDSFAFHSRGRVTHTVVEKYEESGEKISSTAVREFLSEGRTDDAAVLLGRPHSVSGKVVYGEQRGRTIGFPTANVEVDKAVVLPAAGVYAVTFSLDGEILEGVANIGVKPTFHEEHPKTLEVHLFSFDETIYDRFVSVHFHERIRGEVKFPSFDALKTQIAADAQEAERLHAVRRN